MTAVIVIVGLAVVFVAVVFALGLLSAASRADELAEGEVVRRLRPDGNVTKIDGDE